MSKELRNRILLSLAVLAFAGALFIIFPAHPVTAEGVGFDGNSNPATFGVSYVNGVTPIMLRLDPTTKSIFIPRQTNVSAEGFSIDQNVLPAANGQRLFRVDVQETGGGIGYGAIRATPGGAGACTGKAYCYVYTAANGAYACDFGDRGVDASTGVCFDRGAGTYSVSVQSDPYSIP